MEDNEEFYEKHEPSELFTVITIQEGEKIIRDSEGEEDPGEGISKVPRFIVNLDEEPATRWNAVIHHYKQDILYLSKTLKEELLGGGNSFIYKIIETVAGGLVSAITQLGLVKYYKELKGIASELGIPLHEVVLLQFMYEASACCTSIVVPSSTDEETPLHIRTMDWGMSFLKELTVELDFRRNDKTVFFATSWPCYVGILTGMKPFAFSASVNFRVTSSGYFANLKNTISYSWPIGYLLRAVLEDDIDFETAVQSLANSSIIAPVYYTVCGINAGEGRLITRDRENEVNPWLLSEQGPIVQPNMDHWSDDRNDSILYSIERRNLAHDQLQELIGYSDVNEASLFNLLSKFPILNSLTVSATFMNPAKGIFHTRLPHSKQSGFNPTEYPLPLGGAERVTCTSCKKRYVPHMNPSKQCSHSGSWHSTFGHCSKIKCAAGLGRNIGKQHWSCCYSVYYHSPCPKSGPHTN